MGYTVYTSVNTNDDDRVLIEAYAIDYEVAPQPEQLDPPATQNDIQHWYEDMDGELTESLVVTEGMHYDPIADTSMGIVWTHRIERNSQTYIVCEFCGTEIDREDEWSCFHATKGEKKPVCDECYESMSDEERKVLLHTVDLRDRVK